MHVRVRGAATSTRKAAWRSRWALAVEWQGMQLVSWAGHPGWLGQAMGFIYWRATQAPSMLISAAPPWLLPSHSPAPFARMQLTAATIRRQLESRRLRVQDNYLAYLISRLRGPALEACTLKFTLPVRALLDMGALAATTASTSICTSLLLLLNGCCAAQFCPAWLLLLLLLLFSMTTLKCSMHCLLCPHPACRPLATPTCATWC